MGLPELPLNEDKYAEYVSVSEIEKKVETKKLMAQVLQSPRALRVQCLWAELVTTLDSATRCFQ